MYDFSKIFSDLLSKINNVERKINTLETVEYIRFYPIIGQTAYLINTALVVGVPYNSGNLRGAGGIGTRAKGFIGTLWIDPLATSSTVRIVPGNDTLNTFSQLYRWLGAAGEDRQLMSQTVFAFLGPDGDINIDCLTTNCTIYLTAFGYWE